jgi:hypothetical protein
MLSEKTGYFVLREKDKSTQIFCESSKCVYNKSDTFYSYYHATESGWKIIKAIVDSNGNKINNINKNEIVISNGDYCYGEWYCPECSKDL